MDVVAEDGGHLPTLHLGHPVVRVHDEDVDVFAGLAALDGRRAGVAAGGPHDHHALAPLAQHMVEQTTEQLQGEILEGQGRAVEQLQHPLIAVQLAQRRHGVMGEHTVGFLKNPLEVRVTDAAGDKGAHHPEGQFVVRQAGPGGDLLNGKTRQILRHIEAAIAGQAGLQHIFEVQGRCLATGTDIAHC